MKAAAPQQVVRYAADTLRLAIGAGTEDQIVQAIADYIDAQALRYFCRRADRKALKRKRAARARCGRRR